MATSHRLSTTAVLIVCFAATQLSGTLFASGEDPAPNDEPSAQSVVQPRRDEQDAGAATRSASIAEHFRVTLSNEVSAPDMRLAAAHAASRRGALTFASEPPALAQRGGYGGRGRGRNHGAATAIALGAVASIAGGAILLYANRPDCDRNPAAGGCGYGTKVAGGAVLSAGIVGLVVGAVTWR
jgi:hypothetical protein